MREWALIAVLGGCLAVLAPAADAGEEKLDVESVLSELGAEDRATRRYAQEQLASGLARLSTRDPQAAQALVSRMIEMLGETEASIATNLASSLARAPRPWRARGHEAAKTLLYEMMLAAEQHPRLQLSLDQALMNGAGPLSRRHRGLQRRSRGRHRGNRGQVPGGLRAFPPERLCGAR